MVRKLRQLRADLRRAGYAPARQRGSHERWRHPLVPDFRVTLAGADGDDAKPYNERDVRDALARARAARERQEQAQQQEEQQQP